MTTITYCLAGFEGPLDLLLHLISKNQMDITDIPIAEICDQYMQYIEDCRMMDMELTSEFIVMASELMLIKSKMLLPRLDENEPDPRAELVDALLLYQQAKLAVEELRPLYQTYAGRFAKDTDDIPPEKGLPLGLDTSLLTKAMTMMLHRMRMSETSPITLINPLIKPHVVSVESKIERIIRRLESVNELSLFFLLSEEPTRPDLLAAFMGLLELIKLGRVLICETDEEIEGEADLTLKFRLNPDYVPADAKATAESAETTEETVQGGDL